MSSASTVTTDTSTSAPAAASSTSVEDGIAMKIRDLQARLSEVTSENEKLLDEKFVLMKNKTKEIERLKNDNEDLTYLLEQTTKTLRYYTDEEGSVQERVEDLLQQVRKLRWSEKITLVFADQIIDFAE